VIRNGNQAIGNAQIVAIISLLEMIHVDCVIAPDQKEEEDEEDGIMIIMDPQDVVQ